MRYGLLPGMQPTQTRPPPGLRLWPRARVGIGVHLRAGLAGVWLVAGGAGLADEESPALARYREPVDAAVGRALAFLAEKQKEDGSWPSHMPANTAVTSLGVMAFLATGHVPGDAVYGDAIGRGIEFVLASQKENGLLVADPRAHGPMYSHTISTLLLSEVSGMVGPTVQPRLDVALGRALALILKAQSVPKSSKEQGGWRYQADSRDSDISCTGWALMSLRSVRNGGGAVPGEAVDGAVAFVLNCRSPDGGFGYQPGHGAGLARTGTALLCLELSGHHGDEVTLAAGEWILKHLPGPMQAEFFYYAMYYCAQGMFQLGGEPWEMFADHLFKTLVEMQQPDGSWPEGVGNEQQAGACYSTAMSVLALSVVYRQLPIYQR